MLPARIMKTDNEDFSPCGDDFNSLLSGYPAAEEYDATQHEQPTGEQVSRL